MKRNKVRLPYKPLAVMVIILLVIVFILGYIWRALTNRDYFTVKEVTVRNGDFSKFDYLKGRNIFSLDLNRESSRILLACPQCTKVRIARILPDRLFIDFVERKPVAIARFYRYFAIDQEGFFFYASGSQEEQQLPLVYGLETKIYGPKPGMLYNIREVKTVLSIIREFKANRYLKGLELKRIDLSRSQNISLFVLLPPQEANFAQRPPQVPWSGFEVRLTEGDIHDKMVILGGLVFQAKKDLANIKYADLRFKQPVIKLNNDK